MEKESTSITSPSKFEAVGQRGQFRVLVYSGGTCGDDGPCPTVYENVDGSIVLQGYTMTSEEKAALRIPEGEDAVTVPRAFLDRVLSNLQNRS